MKYLVTILILALGFCASAQTDPLSEPMYTEEGLVNEKAMSTEKNYYQLQELPTNGMAPESNVLTYEEQQKKDRKRRRRLIWGGVLETSASILLYMLFFI